MFYRANNKKGYLLTTILTAEAVEMELEDIEYYSPSAPSEVYKDRNIPTILGEQIVLVLWGVQYSSPSADPSRELVIAEWTGVGRTYTIARGQEGTTAGVHYAGDNVAGIYSAEMSREILIFETLKAATNGSLGYTENIDDDTSMEVQALVPDGETSDPEGYQKILCCGGSTGFPFWEFAWDPTIGASRAVL